MRKWNRSGGRGWNGNKVFLYSQPALQSHQNNPWGLELGINFFPKAPLVVPMCSQYWKILLHMHSNFPSSEDLSPSKSLNLFHYSLLWAVFIEDCLCQVGEGNGTPLQYSCLENPMEGGAWWAAVHGVAKSWTRLSNFTFSFHFHALEKEMATHSSVLAWRSPGTGEPGGLPSMGSHRVGHDWSDLAAAAAFAKYITHTGPYLTLSLTLGGFHNDFSPLCKLGNWDSERVNCSNNHIALGAGDRYGNQVWLTAWLFPSWLYLPRQGLRIWGSEQVGPTWNPSAVFQFSFW